MGAYPRELSWAVAGSADGASYRHDAILMVAGGPAPSPHAKSLDRYRLPRIQATETDLNYWIAHFDKNPQDRYVSAGIRKASR
jgi:hypothetical protein